MAPIRQIEGMAPIRQIGDSRVYKISPVAGSAIWSQTVALKHSSQREALRMLGVLSSVRLQRCDHSVRRCRIIAGHPLDFRLKESATHFSTTPLPYTLSPNNIWGVGEHGKAFRCRATKGGKFSCFVLIPWITTPDDVSKLPQRQQEAAEDPVSGGTPPGQIGRLLL